MEFRKHLAANSDKTVFFNVDDQGGRSQSITYGDMLRQADRLAANLVQGSILAVIVERPEADFYLVSCAALFAGVPITVFQASPALQGELQHAAQCLGFDQLLDLRTSQNLWADQATLKLQASDGAKSSLPVHDASPAEPVFEYMWSSGSTGGRKCMPITWSRWAKETAVPPPRGCTLPLRTYSFNSPAWYMSQFSVWRTMWCAGEVSFGNPSFTVLQNYEVIQPSTVFLPPALWEVVFSRPDISHEAVRDSFGPNVCSVSCGAAPVRPDLWKAIKAAFGDKCQTYDGYGLTETGQLMKNGKPHPFVKWYLDSARGELVVSTPYLISGYVNNPEANQRSFVTDADGVRSVPLAFEIELLMSVRASVRGLK